MSGLWCPLRERETHALVFLREVMETESICSCQSKSSCIMGSVSIPVASASEFCQTFSPGLTLVGTGQTSRSSTRGKMLFIYLGSSAVRSLDKPVPYQERWEREGLTASWLRKRCKGRSLRRNDKKWKMDTFGGMKVRGKAPKSRHSFTAVR